LLKIGPKFQNHQISKEMVKKEQRERYKTKDERGV
jgi:hypothetical protein